MDRIWWTFFLAAVLLLSAIVRANADDGAVIDRWYSALLVADRTELSELLADDVRMKLDDIGVVQDKQEFIASIDEWQGAVAGATIRHASRRARTARPRCSPATTSPKTTR